MRTVALTRGRFDVPASFDAEKYLAGRWGMLRGDLVTVRVVFARAVHSSKENCSALSP